ncbi:MAG: hypothetical protein HND55_14100 [Pseudomonadota bacterium]|nr:MAG: hypothetical protein HND55_14100 [Pseudomonadota bacterium]
MAKARSTLCSASGSARAAGLDQQKPPSPSTAAAPGRGQPVRLRLQGDQVGIRVALPQRQRLAARGATNLDNASWLEAQAVQSLQQPFTDRLADDSAAIKIRSRLTRMTPPVFGRGGAAV